MSQQTVNKRLVRVWINPLFSVLKSFRNYILCWCTSIVKMWLPNLVKLFVGLSNFGRWSDLLFCSQMGPFEVFAYGPTLKFKLSWSGTPIARPPRRPTSLALRSPLTTLNAGSTNDIRNPAEEADASKDNRKKQRLFYQFIYNNNTRQQTEAREDFFCPWCSIDCRKLYSLLKHLKLCHGRFIFAYAVSHFCPLLLKFDLP